MAARLRRTVKWRTGSKGRISHLKRGYGWDRTRIDSTEGGGAPVPFGAGQAGRSGWWHHVGVRCHGNRHSDRRRPPRRGGGPGGFWSGGPWSGGGASTYGWIDSASVLAAALSTGWLAEPSHTTNQRLFCTGTHSRPASSMYRVDSSGASSADNSHVGKREKYWESV
jgi:hypothetical protein